MLNDIFQLKEFVKSLSLRRTKTDKADAKLICQKLMSVSYNPNPNQFYHKYSIKSLTRLRESLVQQRSDYLVKITNILDTIFPEFKSFFSNRFSATSIYILDKYKSAEKIAKMKDFDSISKVSRGKFTYPKFVQLRQLAKDSVGESNDIFELELQVVLRLYKDMDSQIVLLDKQISTIIKELNPPTLSIPGIGEIMCAIIISDLVTFLNSPIQIRCYLLQV